MATCYFWLPPASRGGGSPVLIGRESWGWRFLLSGEGSLRSWRSWKAVLDGEGEVVNHYGRRIEPRHLTRIVEESDGPTYPVCLVKYALGEVWMDEEAYPFLQREIFPASLPPA